MGEDGTSSDAKPGGELFDTDDAVALYTDRVEDPAFFPQERKAVERYFTASGASVLDVGCGSGRVSRLLADRGFDVVGIDVSEPLVEKARSLFPDIEFRVEDVREASFDAESFDYVVFSHFGLDYILPKAEREKALREMYRLLKPGGLVLFSSHNSWHPFLSVLSLFGGGGTDAAKSGVKDLWDLYLRPENRDRLRSRHRTESVPLGDVDIYLSNPVHQWLQLRKAGFTLLDVVGERDGPLRLFERDPHYVAKK